MKASVVTFTKRQEQHCATAVALAWYGYLRGNEVLSLRLKDIALAGNPRITGVNNYLEVLIVLDAKTGTNQFVPISDRPVFKMFLIFSQQTKTDPEKKILLSVLPKTFAVVQSGVGEFRLKKTALNNTINPHWWRVTRVSGERGVKDIAIT